MTNWRVFSKERTCFYNLDKRAIKRQGHGKVLLSKRQYVPKWQTNNYKAMKWGGMGLEHLQNSWDRRNLQKANMTLKLWTDRKILTVYKGESLPHLYHWVLEVHLPHLYHWTLGVHLVQNEISSECKAHTHIVLMTFWKKKKGLHQCLCILIPCRNKCEIYVYVDSMLEIYCTVWNLSLRLFSCVSFCFFNAPLKR